jgi:transmembrane sensor
LVFEDRPLGQVIADVNRYRPGRIYITDEALLTLPVSGIFNIREPDSILKVIQQTLPVRITELTSYLVLLRPA